MWIGFYHLRHFIYKNWPINIQFGMLKLSILVSILLCIPMVAPITIIVITYTKYNMKNTLNGPACSHTSFYVFICMVLICHLHVWKCWVWILIFLVSKWPFWVTKNDLKSQKMGLYHIHIKSLILFTFESIWNKNPNN